MSKTFSSCSPEQTEAIGAQLAERAFPGMVVAFTGDLGAGKTAFCRGFLRQLGYAGRVTSPTFAIVNEYETDELHVCHFDMYRITDADMLFDIGWDDYLDGEQVLLIEWSENITDELPEGCVTVDIRRGQSDSDRIITINGGTIE